MCAKQARVLSKQCQRCGGVTQASPLLQLGAPHAEAITRGLNMCRKCEQGGCRGESAENSGDMLKEAMLRTEHVMLR